MKDDVGWTLCQIIAGQGREVAGDPRRLEAMLRDLCPGNVREVYVLATAARLGIPRELDGSADGVLRDLLTARLVRRLIDETAMQRDAAAWAVEAWAAGLGMKLELDTQLPPAVRPAEQVAEVPSNLMVASLAPGVEMELVRVPAGEFLMGSDPKRDAKAREDEQPQRRVYLEEYWIGKHPVTNAQYAAYVQATRAQAPKHWERGRIPGGKAKHPVVNVSWDDARRFCQWVSQATGEGIRLPTEAEWEKAARGTDGRIYPWGDVGPDRERCNYDENVGHTTPVGQYSPMGDSPYGCVDMAGNVWEWVADWLDEDYYKNAPAQNPQGPSSGVYRVLRGGGWDGIVRSVRAADRDRLIPDYREVDVGFRCARSR